MNTSWLRTSVPLKNISPNVLKDEILRKRCRFLYVRMYTNGKIKTTPQQYCMDLVKRSDYENFMATMLLPQKARSVGVAVRAFNVEISQIQDFTSEKLMAKMRLQFWRETLDQIYNDSSPRQPVAIALLKAIQKHKLSKRWLRSLIDSREDWVDNKQFASLESLESYSEKSNSVLYYLVLQGLGIENINADHAASHLGKAEGITRLIRGIPHHATKRNVYLPRDILMQHKVSQEDIIRGNRDQPVKDVVYDIASLAHQHLKHAQSLLKEVPKEARVALLPAVSVSSYLAALQHKEFDVFEPSLLLRNNLVPFKMLWAKLSKKY